MRPEPHPQNVSNGYSDPVSEDELRDEISRLRSGINDTALMAEQLSAITGVEGFRHIARRLRGLKD